MGSSVGELNPKHLFEVNREYLIKDIPYPQPEIRWCVQMDDGTWYVAGYPTKDDLKREIEKLEE